MHASAPHLAHHQQPQRRTGRWTQRRPVALLAAIAVLGCLITGFGLFAGPASWSRLPATAVRRSDRMEVVVVPTKQPLPRRDDGLPHTTRGSLPPRAARVVGEAAADAPDTAQQQRLVRRQRSSVPPVASSRSPRSRDCRSTFAGFDASARPNGGGPSEAATARRYSTDPLEPSLVAQLLTYKRRVGGKLRTPSSTGGSSVNPLWAPYLDARVDTAHCFRAYPECAIFNRTELRLGENAAATKGGAASLLAAPDEIDRFMVRKCCIEHDQMLRALRSLNAALRSSSSTSSGGSNSRGVKKGGPAAGAAGTVADRDGGGGDDDAGLPLVWLTAGTLLGAVREGGRFIPWDTDVDVLVEPRHEAAVLDLLRRHTRDRPARLPRIVVAEREEEDDPLDFAAQAVTEVKDHAHGRMIGVVYGTPHFRHPEASRVEIWVAQEDRKMQRAAVNLPRRPCRMYDVLAACPARPLDVLESGYGPFWCVSCKTRSQNCKEELQKRLGAPAPHQGA